MLSKLHSKRIRSRTTLPTNLCTSSVVEQVVSKILVYEETEWRRQSQGRRRTPLHKYAEASSLHPSPIGYLLGRLRFGVNAPRLVKSCFADCITVDANSRDQFPQRCLVLVLALALAQHVYRRAVRVYQINHFLSRVQSWSSLCLRIHMSS